MGLVCQSGPQTSTSELPFAAGCTGVRESISRVKHYRVFLVSFLGVCMLVNVYRSRQLILSKQRIKYT